MPAASINWTDERVDQLKLLWEAGGTCSEIGAEMCITRSAVIGKVHRLKLSARRATPSEQDRFIRSEEQRRLRGTNKKIRERKVQEPIIPSARTPFIGALNIPFGDLRPWLSGAANECRFIADAGPNYLACGNETLPGESWCGHCRDIVFGRATVATLVPEKVAA